MLSTLKLAYFFCVTSMRLLQKICSYKCQFCTKLWASSAAIALSYPPRVRFRTTVKLSSAFFHDESPITKVEAWKGNSAHLPRLVFQVHMMTWQNVKKKYLMCQIPIKTLKQHATPNSSWRNLKIYSSKGCWKTSQRWVYVAS